MIPGGKNATHTHPEGGLQVCLKRVKGLTKPGLLKKPYYFQIAPLNEFGYDAAANFVDYEVVRRGQFTRGGARALRTISFQSMVIDYNPRWAVLAGGNRHRGHDEDGGAPIPRKVVDDLDEMLAAVTPLRLIVWNKGLDERADVNWIVTFRSFNPRERGGEPDSRYFDFSFVEWRGRKLRRRGYSGSSRGHDLPMSVRIDRQGIATEMVRDNTSGEGDDGDKDETGHRIGSAKDPATLRELALHFYGESNHWREVAAYNGITGLGPDETLAHLDKRGRKARIITIPEVTWEAKTAIAQAKKAR